MQILLEKRKSLGKSSFAGRVFEGQSGAFQTGFHVITCRPSDEREETFADGGQRGNRVTEISAPGFIIYGFHQSLICVSGCFRFVGCRLRPGHIWPTYASVSDPKVAMPGCKW
ncbi:hypothetical protein F9K85_21660 [Brucella tritici]|uniref:Uncharacterized protein n=1 Tax=Brucella tritici TaxID=94626 RepID=A0A833FML6_9HYPH|nr:hypothetical protein F9K91_23940 [Brucella tritici]KAB2671480.1 hypothetical protein F9K85_21660 [Brucella tritici]